MRSKLRSRFVYVGPRASSFSQPAARIPSSHSLATLSIVFCFRNADTYAEVSEAGRRLRSRREVAFFVCVQWLVHIFCSVFSQVAGGPPHSSGEAEYGRDLKLIPIRVKLRGLAVRAATASKYTARLRIKCRSVVCGRNSAARDTMPRLSLRLAK